MENKELEEYTTLIQNTLKKNLSKRIGIKLHVYPARKGGVVEVTLGKDLGLDNKVNVEGLQSTVNVILKKVPQKLITGNLDSIQFMGTSISLEDNRILLIKGDDTKWGKAEAKQDIAKVLTTQTGAL